MHRHSVNLPVDRSQINPALVNKLPELAQEIHWRTGGCSSVDLRRMEGVIFPTVREILVEVFRGGLTMAMSTYSHNILVILLPYVEG